MSCLPDSLSQQPRRCLCWRLAVTLQALHSIRSQAKPDPVAIFGGLCAVGHTCPDCRDSCSSFDARRIFDRLQTLNAAAYASRYEEAPSPVYSMPETFPHFLHRMPFEKGRYILGPDFFGFVKALDSLIYQCEEDANRAEPLLDALQKTSAALYVFAVRQSADYAAADWIL